MSVTIRKARESDAEEISALILSLARYYISEPNAPEVRPFLETLSPGETADRINSDEFGCFVAEKENEICGVIAVREKTHIYHLFVQSKSHRQGIAGALWQYILNNSDAGVFTVNSSLFAVPIYEKFGFEVVSEPQEAEGLIFVPMEFKHDN